MPATVRAIELELDNFKSFGKKTVIPFGDGFTTISGPNGSGKSNILDSILFVLGLTTSKTLRAERLPDLINNRSRDRRQAAVTFRLSVEPEDADEAPRIMEIRRVIRAGGDNYSSTYYLDGKVRPLSRIHDELNKLNISPRGNNIILQGDVTRITTMSPLERRRIIDDLAGVAEFDSRIQAARDEMDKATRHMEDLGIVADEINVRLEELETEKDRAVEYTGLRERKEELEAVILLAELKDLQRKRRAVDRDLEKLDKEVAGVRELFPAIASRLDAAREELDKVDAEIRAKGEDEKLAMLRRLEEAKGAIARHEEAIGELKRRLAEAARSENGRRLDVEQALSQVESIRATLLEDRKAVETTEQAIRSRQREAGALYKRIEELSTSHAGQADRLNDLRTKITELRVRKTRAEAALQEASRRHQERRQALEAARTRISEIEQELADVRTIIEDELETRTALAEEVDTAQRRLDGTRWEKSRARNERDRIEHEIRTLYREMTRAEAQAKVAGQMKSDRAVKAVLESGFRGIHGTVAQLISVPAEYATATEIAAGRRLNNIVVDDEAVAARCIELLKETGSGRVTFLPLNKIRGRAPDHILRLEGTRGYLVDLLSFKPRYKSVAAHVFGDTVVVETLERANQLIGQFRMVTLDGELLERSGAITGGSLDRSAGSRLAVDLEGMRRKLAGLEDEGKRLVARLDELEEEESRAADYLDQARKNLGTLDLDIKRDRAEEARLDGELKKLRVELAALEGSAAEAGQEEDRLQKELDRHVSELHSAEEEMRSVEGSLEGGELEEAHRKTSLLEAEIRELNEKILGLNEKIRLGELEISYHERNVEGWREELGELARRKEELQALVEERQAAIRKEVERRKELEEKIAGISDQLVEYRARRDERLKIVEDIRAERFELEAKIRAADDRRAILEERAAELDSRLDELQAELANKPRLAEEKLSSGLTPNKIRRELADIEEKMREMEPVNMRAIEQHEELLARKEELKEKLDKLQAEKRELKQRMTSFGRQKYEAFMATFRQVKENYERLYEELSDGEGILVLDNEEDPFAGGLAIKASPRGKKMERLEALSGGEKSLAALAFVFAFQSHNPAPFYVFDEVDMFLDGANTERLADMLRRQSSNTQFLVVSLRKAMLQRSHRTIGVTQTRKGFSQVTGLDLARFQASDQDKQTERAGER